MARTILFCQCTQVSVVPFVEAPPSHVAVEIGVSEIFEKGSTLRINALFSLLPLEHAGQLPRGLDGCDDTATCGYGGDWWERHDQEFA